MPRRRSFDELNDPERIRRLSLNLSPYHTPKVIRNYIRNHYVVELVDFLYDVATGVVQFEVLGEDGKVVKVPAPPKVRTDVASAVIKFATIDASVHHLGDDNESAQGAIALPDLDLQNAQRRLHAGLGRELTPGAVNGSGSVQQTEYTVPAPGHEEEE
jgi:hypothetical protein